MASGGYDRLRERDQSGEELESEFVAVPRDLKGHVIGRGGCMIQEIRQKSGARVVSQNMEEEGFTVFGDEEQRACARRLIEQKLKDVKSTMWEHLKIEEKYKGFIIGKRGAKLREIYNQTGAKVIYNSDDTELYIILGSEEQRKLAKIQIGESLSALKLRGVENKFSKFSCYIDDWKLPSTKLKLRLVQKGLPVGSRALYRLTSVEEYKTQESCSSSNYSGYQLQLMKDVLVTLRVLKRKMAEMSPKVDMWCHFGTVTVFVPDQVAEGEWSVDEATEKIQSSNGKHRWKLTFKEGVNVNERLLKSLYKERIPEDIAYVARYDLTFRTPRWHQVRCKVLVANKEAGTRLKDIPIPLRDVKNILKEIYFEDKETRSRCRGWLVFKSRKFLRSHVMFPGCEFDCRFTIRQRTENATESTLHATDDVPEEDLQDVLLDYLSGLTLKDEDVFTLHLPEKAMPEGFTLIDKRCSKRSEYTNVPGFTIIISNERTWNKGGKEFREMTDVRVHYNEWDTLLSSGVWEPEVIVKKLPEFVEFVKEVQAVLFRDKIPPEILARGSSALEAYKKALADGKTSVRRVPIMLIGQDQAGKTSLKKSLKGICFDPEEDSTVGIDMDLSHFKVTTETWRTGTTNQDQNSDAALSLEYHTARYIVESLKEKQKSMEVNTDADECSSSFDYDDTEMPADPRPTEPSRDAEDIRKIRDPASTPGRHVFHASPDSTEKIQEVDTYSTPDVEEVAVVTETLLRDNLEDSRENIYSILWDFAGQAVYYVTHPLFLTARAIYCLVYDLSLNPHDNAKPVVKQGVFKTNEESFNLKTNLDYLDFWMMSVASQASSLEDGLRSEVLPEKLPPVFLVCTHADTPYGGRDPKDLARQIFGYLKSKPYGAHLSGVFFVDNTFLRVNKSECPEVQRLRREVFAVAKELPHINEAVPIKWLNFEKKLQAVKEKGNKYISLEAARDIAENVCSINEEKEFETLMNYLHDLRILIHFDDTAELNNTVVLDPQWLVDVFKKVITVKPFDCRETKFLDLWCKLEREGILDEQLLAHVWGPLFENEETCESLIGIMERFSLLCPWPSDAALSNKNYLVPSMLKSHPPNKILDLVASAKIPSLFIKFENGQVPPGLFPRLMLQFFLWGNKNMWRSGKPQLFHNVARFFTTFHDNSIILMCHSLSIEVVVHGGDLVLVDDVSSKMTLSADIHHDTAGVTCARLVQRRLGLMLECMRNEFSWLKNMKYEMSVICPVCCQGRAIHYCRTHDVQGCRQEQCLHFLTLSELCKAKKSFICTNSVSAQNIKVQVAQFSPWFATPEQQKLAIGEHGESTSLSDEGNEKKALALPGEVMDCLLSTSCDSKQVVVRLTESLQLDPASLKQPDPETKKWIRCLAGKAKRSERPDVFDHLREITPAGTTGPLLTESFDVRTIPTSKVTELAIALSGGDEWKLVAEKLGLNPEKIRYLDKRTLNPADALLSHIANTRYLTVGELYEVLCDCGVPVMADRL